MSVLVDGRVPTNKRYRSLNKKFTLRISDSELMGLRDAMIKSTQRKTTATSTVSPQSTPLNRESDTQATENHADNITVRIYE
jgi:hypothetical protein